MTAKSKYIPFKDIIINNICNAEYDENTLKKSLEYNEMYFLKNRINIVLCSTGYPTIRYKGTYIRLHRIIGQYLYNDKRGAYMYHHKDGNKLNAMSDNIEQMTLSEHQKLHGKNRTMPAKARLAISKARKGVIPGNIRAVLMLDKDNNILREFISTKEAASQLNIHRTAITNNLNNRSKYCNNYKFVYKDEYKC